eukprot:CAMPEP_0167810946 /NCGR_PEP_ID=MMETSP0112_2-20121227/379_1 /TAXON_ID=91324 /ORGANISM="Lotharella globosa, Strain CCCM811" /LENGTH=269 /DNA_ID=CAMNT_0007709571 /DNA_START=149 /DNA_END=958 /DNA_ORIENTATION=-
MASPVVSVAMMMHVAAVNAAWSSLRSPTEPLENLRQALGVGPVLSTTTTTKFVVATLPRSGSTFLGATLNEHPCVRDHGEIFLPGRLQRIGKQYGFVNYTDIPEKDIPWKQAMDTAFNLHKTYKHKPNVTTVGFKWMLQQGLEENLDDAITEMNHQDVHLIVLVRTNLLRQAVSLYCIKNDLGSAHLRGNHSKKLDGPTDVPVSFFLNYFARRRERSEPTWARLKNDVKHVLYITYEVQQKCKPLWKTRKKCSPTALASRTFPSPSLSM